MRKFFKYITLLVFATALSLLLLVPARYNAPIG